MMATEVAARLEHPADEVRDSAVEALQVIGKKDRIAGLEAVKRLRHKEWWCREAAVRALGGMGEMGIEHFDKVKLCLEDEDPGVRMSTVHALRDMGKVQDSKREADVRLAPLRHARAKGALAVLRHCMHIWMFNNQAQAIVSWRENTQEARERATLAWRYRHVRALQGSEAGKAAFKVAYSDAIKNGAELAEAKEVAVEAQRRVEFEARVDAL